MESGNDVILVLHELLLDQRVRIYDEWTKDNAGLIGAEFIKNTKKNASTLPEAEFLSTRLPI